jgi:hypothetical protein
VLIVVTNGERPLREDLLTRNLGVPEAGALFGVAIDRTQQRINVDERPRIRAGQDRGPRGQSDQVRPGRRGELFGVTEGELPQQDPQGRGGIDPVEQRGHPTAADHFQVIDAVCPSGHPGDDTRQFPRRIHRA